MKQEEAQIISEVLGDYEKARSAHDPKYEEQKKDYQYYLGKQWDDGVRAALEEQNRPVLTINLTKKNVDAVTGYERQNRMDIKAYPIEGGDEVVSEALSRIIKINTTNNNVSFLRSRAFKDASITGEGWIGAYMNFDRDFVNGDISFEHIPFNEIMIDPYTLNPDLSDCMYVIRHRKMDRKVLADIYSKKAKAIMDCKDDPKTDSRSVATDNQKSQDLLSAIEYWYVSYDKKNILIDEKGTSLVFNGSDEELGEMVKENPNLTVFTKKVRNIKLRTVIGKSILAYDGPNPYGISMYPFIPYWFYFDSSYNESDSWKYKVQGIVRFTRDPQDEKNKQRSALQEAVSKSIHQSWIMEEGSVDDESQYRYSAGSGHVLKYNRNRPMPQRLESPPVNGDLFNLIAMNDQDFRLVSLNPDVLGQIGEKGSSGYLAQIRQKQGLMTLQEPFDHLHIANRMIGRIIIEFVGKFYSREKVKRLLGNDLPFPTDKMKQKQYAQLQQMEQQIEEAAPQLQQQMEDMRQSSEDEANAMMQQVQGEFQQRKMAIDKLKELLMIQEEAEADFWAAFSVIGTGNIYYDIAIDETAENPTYRLGSSIILQNLIQSGVPINPNVVMELQDIPESTKKQQREWQQQQEEAQAQAQQQQMQLEMYKLQIEMFKARAMYEKSNPGQIPQLPNDGGAETQEQA